MIAQSHATLIAVAYLVSALAIGGAALAIMLDYRRQRRALERLEAAAERLGKLRR